MPGPIGWRGSGQLRRRTHAGPGHLGRHLLTRVERLDQRLVRRRAVQVRPQPGVVQPVDVSRQHRGADVALAGHQPDVGDDHGELRLVADDVLRLVGDALDRQRGVRAVVALLEHRRRRRPQRSASGVGGGACCRRRHDRRLDLGVLPGKRRRGGGLRGCGLTAFFVSRAGGVHDDHRPPRRR